MSKNLSVPRSATTASRDFAEGSDQSSDAPWLALVAEKAKTLSYGVIQITVHDSRVVQVECTERCRFDTPRGR